MAATGYTPISLYYSTTAAAVPTSGNLVSGELALNIADMKLYAKNSAGTVTLLASSASTTGVDSLSFGSTGLTPSTATTGAVTVAGTLATTNGGTGRTAYTANSVLYASSTSAIASGSAFTYDGTTLKNAPTSSGVTPSANANGLFLDSSGNGGLTIATGASSLGNIYFADTGDQSEGFIQYAHTGRTMAFGAAGSTQMTLASTGLGIGVTPTVKFDLAGDYREGVVTANTSTAYTISLATGTVQILTLTGNCTYTFPTPVAGKSFTLIQAQDATGSRTVTWPASVDWPSATAPTLTATALKVDKFVFTAISGTSWLGSVAGQNYTV